MIPEQEDKFQNSAIEKEILADFVVSYVYECD